MSLEHSNMIDALGIDESSGRVVLVIRHDEAWNGSARQLYLLQEKLNAYLSFALDGEMAAAYPHLMERPLGVRIDSPGEPDAGTAHLLGHVRRQLEFQDITLEVRLMEGLEKLDPVRDAGHGCGGGCGCH